MNNIYDDDYDICSRKINSIRSNIYRNTVSSINCEGLMDYISTSTINPLGINGFIGQPGTIGEEFNRHSVFIIEFDEFIKVKNEN